MKSVTDLLDEYSGSPTRVKVVGWFQGRIEWIRALSEIAAFSPRNPQVKDIVRAKLKSRKRLAPILISVVSICTTVMLLEIAIRIIKPQDIGFWDSHSIRRLQNTPHFVENIPHGRANLFGVQVSINSYGLREDEISVPNPAHTFRLLVVGDSITFGYGIPVEETYVKVLEKRLNENASANRRYEVLNGGTIGGSLGDYYHLLNQKAEVLKPDLVLVGLALNDILAYSESGLILGQRDAHLHGRELILIRKLNRFLLRHSQLYIFCYARLKSFLYGSGILVARRSEFVTRDAAGSVGVFPLDRPGVG